MNSLNFLIQIVKRRFKTNEKRKNKIFDHFSPSALLPMVGYKIDHNSKTHEFKKQNIAHHLIEFFLEKIG